jgi:hypothetical protein
MAELTKEQLENKFNVLLLKREELIEAINRIDGALEAVDALYKELEDGSNKEGSEPSCEISGGDKEPHSKKKGDK